MPVRTTLVLNVNCDELLKEFLRPTSRAYVRERYCHHCGKRLSIYNPHQFCWAFFEPTHWINEWMDEKDRMRGLMRIAQVDVLIGRSFMDIDILHKVERLNYFAKRSA